MFNSAAELLRVTDFGLRSRWPCALRQVTRGPFLLHSVAEAAHHFSP
jgi:hypothetical protein